MEKKNLQKSITVNATAKEALKNIAQVKKWWAKNCTGNAKRPNDTFTVHFGETFVDFEISELIPEKRVVWKVTDCHLHWVKKKKEWKGTQVVFDISERKNGTRIRLTHEGLNADCECYEDCRTGWAHHLKKGLALLIEEGKGFPM